MKVKHIPCLTANKLKLINKNFAMYKSTPIMGYRWQKNIMEPSLPQNPFELMYNFQMLEYVYKTFQYIQCSFYQFGIFDTCYNRKYSA